MVNPSSIVCAFAAMLHAASSRHVASSFISFALIYSDLIKPTGEVTLANMTTGDGVTTELNFSVSDTNGGASLTPSGDIELTQTTGTEVVFEYRFENTADTLFTIGMKSRHALFRLCTCSR